MGGYDGERRRSLAFTLHHFTASLHSTHRKMKTLRSFATVLCLALLAFFLPPGTASASTHVPTISAAPVAHAVVAAPTKSPLGPIAPLSLLGFALAGATEEAKTKKLLLRRTYLFGGESYGPGRDVIVPADFPDLDEQGNVKHASGSAAEKNAARSRPTPVPAGTRSVDTADTVSGKSFEELSEMRKSELEELAIESGVEVTRGDGGEGSPLVEDYVTALSAPKTA